MGPNIYTRSQQEEEEEEITVHLNKKRRNQRVK